MTPTITIDAFSKRDHPAGYRAYRSIKYDVFAREMGWAGLEDPSGEPVAREDPFDDAGRFVLARTEAGKAVGVVRGIGLNEGFPHRDLFEHHLDDERFQQAYPQLITVNALAVLPEHRKGTFRVDGWDWCGSAGKLLMLALFRFFEREHRLGAVATAGGLPSAVFFRKLGCQVMDPPFATALHREPLTNFGIIFGSAGHRRAEEICHMKPDRPAGSSPVRERLQKYFRYCQERSLSSRPLESWF